MKLAMRIPQPTIISPLAQLSPTVYEALLRCRARAAWSAHGDRTGVPLLPKALLGICFHSVVEEAYNGKLTGLAGVSRSAAARGSFDRCARAVYAQAHPLLHAKFSAPEKLPYYNLYRERAVLEAGSAAERIERKTGAEHPADASQPSDVIGERRLVSRDGLIVGRPDLIDTATSEVVDYKTGTAPDDGTGTMSEAEMRQLRLYVYLAIDNGIRVSRAAIARADGQRASIEVSAEEAADESRQARRLLAEYNDHAGEAFDIAAQPAPENCRFCPCIPFCEAFWRSASADWAGQCGIHLEGGVEDIEASTVQGLNLVTLRIEARRGTVAAGDVHVEQIPEAWTTADGADRPRDGDVVRVVYGRVVSETPPRVVRVDRMATSVWTITPPGMSCLSND